MGGKGGMFDGWVLYLPAQSLVRHTYIHSPKACLNSKVESFGPVRRY